MTPRRAVRLLVPLSACALLMPLAPAHASGDTWTVPRSARITITGHGYGHGHGMSQYGAEGAARQGLTARRIMRFYYPGTSIARTSGMVKVLISADTTRDLVVLPRTGLSLRDRAGGTTWRLPENGAARWRLDLAGNTTVVAFRRGGSWHRWRTLRGDGVFTAGGDPIRLVTPTGTVAYRGQLRAASVPGREGELDTVNVLSLENYLRGVVPLEMPASWTPAAVRAQAIAARTYAAFERERPLADLYQICDTAACQVYGGASAEHPDSDRAIAGTRNVIVTAGGKPAFTQFSSSSGGWTDAGSRPYLVSKRDPYDGWTGNPVHTWRETVTDRALERRYPGIGELQRISVLDRNGHGEWGGRVRRLRLTGSAGSATASGDDLRIALGLRSNWFTFTVPTR